SEAHQAVFAPPLPASHELRAAARARVASRRRAPGRPPIAAARPDCPAPPRRPAARPPRGARAAAGAARRAGPPSGTSAREAPSIDLGAGTSVRDMRETFVPELPEAAVRDGVAYLGVVADRDGRRKVVLGGHTTPETVRAFMADWAPSQGLVDIYGDPARG